MSPNCINKPGLIVIFLILAGSAEGDTSPSVEGIWLNGDGDGWIQLSITDGELRGRIIGSPDDPRNANPSRLDDRNPDRSQRSRPLRGMIILSGFRYAGGGRWTGGRVYDPNSGNTYRGTVILLDANKLKLRGYIGISLFGRTDVWTRRLD